MFELDTRDSTVKVKLAVDWKYSRIFVAMILKHRGCIALFLSSSDTVPAKLAGSDLGEYIF